MPNQSHQLDASLLGANADFAVGPFTTVSVQVAKQSGGTANGATYIVKRSADGANFVGFPKPVVILGSGITAPIDARATMMLRVEVSTADGSGPAIVNVSLFGDGN